MEKEYKFGRYGVTALNNKLGFEEIHNDGDLIVLETTKILEHEENGLKFKYNYVIRVEDVYKVTGDIELKGKCFITLFLVVENESIHEDLMKEIIEEIGIEPEDVGFFEKHWHGVGTVRMLHEIIDNSEIDDKIETLKSLGTTVNRLRGFHLDQPIDMLGRNTGWDVIHQAVNNEKLK